MDNIKESINHGKISKGSVLNVSLMNDNYTYKIIRDVGIVGTVNKKLDVILYLDVYAMTDIEDIDSDALVQLVDNTVLIPTAPGDKCEVTEEQQQSIHEWSTALSILLPMLAEKGFFNNAIN